MRGKRRKDTNIGLQRRITPAHAGKTPARPYLHTLSQDHPRACGENNIDSVSSVNYQGSPPRMRGKHSSSKSSSTSVRITPAHAGKTTHRRTQNISSEDHPRACGENPGRISQFISSAGSPPRMRGKQPDPPPLQSLPRITPAHAGKTTIWEDNYKGFKDHPRACGENKNTFTGIRIL